MRGAQASRSINNIKDAGEKDAEHVCGSWLVQICWNFKCQQTHNIPISVITLTEDSEH